MNPTQKVGPMPTEQRAKIKRLAEAATAGRWQDHALLLEPADLVQLAQGNDQAAVGLAVDMPSGPRRVVAMCGPLHDKASRLTAAYIAAASPDVVLALLQQLAAAEARATEAAAEAGKWQQRHGELQQELAEQEVQTLALVQENETLSEALRGAEYALGNCYDVTEWPADGSTIQDDALNRAIAVLSAAAAPAPVAPQQQEGGGRG